MKLTINGKLLLCVAILLLSLSFCVSRFAGYASFGQTWLAVVSTISLVGASAAAFFCIIDTLLENEE